MSEQSPTYFDTRMQALGISPEANKIDLWQYDAKAGKNVLATTDIFTPFTEGQGENKKVIGIEILLYTLERHTVRIEKNKKRWRDNYTVVRYENPPVNSKTGEAMKYLMPKGHPTMPFFPPALVKAYDDKAVIPVLYITEGYFKAFKAQMHGIYCIGLPSITCMRDKETGKLHADIISLVHTCKVRRIVWLTDGDCREITGKDITEGIDLYKRPAQFYNSVSTFYDLCSIFDGEIGGKGEGTGKPELYFAHIHSANFMAIDGDGVLQPGYKGLDDLLCGLPGETAEIVTEAHSFDTIHEGIYPGRYFVKMKITYGIGKVHKYFLLHDINTFVHHHADKRPEILKVQFKFNGTHYKYNDADDKKCCEVVIPGEAKDYFRVGDNYYRYVEIPTDDKGTTIQTYRPRNKSTITDDHGTKFLKHIPKYVDECIVPDHKNYQRIINNCFNVYHPFMHEPAEGDCDTIIGFFKHIFGENEIHITRADGSKHKIKSYELGLDYVHILYKFPTQILPILCLVSKENNTGKTTFVNFLKYMFGENVADVGNNDLSSDFNAHWGAKLIIAIQEAMIEKALTVEKIKALSTGNEMMVNSKGKDQVAKKFFGKFIFCSNNEDTFIRIGQDDVRYWVIKVPVIQKLNLDMEKDMREELPAFLHYLENRQLATDRQYRHWFHPQYLVTDALRKVQANSLPAIQKKLELELEYLFAASALETITIPLKAIAKDLLRRPDDTDYIRRVLQNMGYKSLPSQRRTYPRIEEVPENEGIGQGAQKVIKLKPVPVSFHSSYYEFHRADFLDEPVAPIDDKDNLPF